MRLLSWHVFVVVGVVAAVASMATATTIVGVILHGGVTLGAVAAVASAARGRAADAAPWLAFAAGLAWFALGDALIAASARTLGGVLVSSWADALSLAGYACLGAGLVVLWRRHPGGDPTAPIDAAIVAIGAAMLAWVFRIAPAADDPTLGLPGRLVAFAYPVADLALLAIALRLVLAGGWRSTSARLLGLAFATLLAADALFAAAQLAGSSRRGGPADLLWLLSSVAFGAAALHPSLPGLIRSSPQASRRLGRGRFAALVTATLVGPTLVAAGLAGRNPRDAAVIGIGTGLLFLLAIARVAGLADRLERTLVRNRTSEARFGQALAAERDLLASLLASLPDAVYIKDTDSRFVRLNQATADQLGVADPATAIGKTDADFFPPAQVSEYHRDEQRVLETGEPLLGKTQQHGTGEGARWVVASKAPLRDGAGRTIGLVGINHDITERRRAEADLRESEVRFRTLVEQLPAIVSINAIDPETTTHYISSYAETLLGYTPAELLADPTGWIDQIHPADRERVLAEIERTNASGEPFTMEYR
ncbi:MAG: PAS domain-containing protein, partial [Chloroflexia bacterium]|nr:PAS domain-containing protein [Chloroflexia bacterium]